MQAQGYVIVIEAAAGDVRGGAVVFQCGRGGIDDYGVAGHHREGGDMEVIFGGEGIYVTDVCRRRAQPLQCMRPVLRIGRGGVRHLVSRYSLTHVRIIT